VKEHAEEDQRHHGGAAVATSSTAPSLSHAAPDVSVSLNGSNSREALGPSQVSEGEASDECCEVLGALG
jgi:hypothetical protein